MKRVRLHILGTGRLGDGEDCGSIRVESPEGWPQEKTKAIFIQTPKYVYLTAFQVKKVIKALKLSLNRMADKEKE